MTDTPHDVAELFKHHPAVLENPALLDKMVADYYALHPPVQLPSIDEILDMKESEYHDDSTDEIGEPSPPDGPPDGGATPASPEPQIPEILRQKKQWTLFKRTWDPEKHKWDKKPRLPNCGDPPAGYPDVTNPSHFGTYDDVRKIADLDDSFVPALYLLKEDGLLFADFDFPCAIPQIPSYTERSISGGYHVIAHYSGDKPAFPDTKEVYLERRWMVITGVIVDGNCDINDITDWVKGKGYQTISPATPGHCSPAPTAPPKITVMRHNTLLSYAGSMRAKGSTPNEILAALSVANIERCCPPLPDSEVRSIALSMGNYQAGNLPAPCSIKPVEIAAAETAGELRDRGDAAIHAIASIYNVPEKVFIRKNALVRVAFDEDGIPQIREVNRDGLLSILASCVNWFRKIKEVDPATGREVHRDPETKAVVVPTLGSHSVVFKVKAPSKPPLEIVQYVLGKQDWDELPPLVAITECPYITDKGDVVSEPGYNWENGLYLALEPGFAGLNIPVDPTDADVDTAKKLVFDLYSDFKFEDDASRQNNIACLITAVIRPFIDGVTPLFAYDKPVMGTGASLLGEIISGIITKRPSPNMPVPRGDNEDEWRKFILSCVRSGRSFFVLDNIEGQFYNTALASVLTSRHYGGRLLGVNDLVGYPNVATWMCNGNNLMITGDLPRRVVYIRLVADVERPYERTDFAIKEISRYVTEHRSEYIQAVLTIAKAWFKKGQHGPAADLQVMGGYDRWRSVIGGIMNFIGCSEFLKNTKKNLELSEMQLGEESDVLEQIYEIQQNPNARGIGGGTIPPEFTTRDISDHLMWENMHPGDRLSNLVEFMPDRIQEMMVKHPKGVAQSIAGVFGHMKGKVFPNGYRIDQVRIDHHAVVYRITSREERQEIGGVNVQ